MDADPIERSSTARGEDAEACRLWIVPLTLGMANAFVAAHHRHHGRVLGDRYSLGVVDASGGLRGVAIMGRPVARLLDDGSCVEVTRLCADGAPNAAPDRCGRKRSGNAPCTAGLAGVAASFPLTGL